jgi:hypothetical protein
MNKEAVEEACCEHFILLCQLSITIIPHSFLYEVGAAEAAVPHRLTSPRE